MLQHHSVKRARPERHLLRNTLAYERMFVLGYAQGCQVDRAKFCALALNPLTPNDPYGGRTAPLTSKHYILYIYSTNIGIEYLKQLNPLTPNDPYRGRTASLTCKHCILYIYSTNIGTEYFKHDIYFPFFPLQNTVCFIILTYLVPVLFIFYIQYVLKFKKKNPAPKGQYLWAISMELALCHTRWT